MCGIWYDTENGFRKEGIRLERLKHICFSGINGIFGVWGFAAVLLIALNIASYYYNVVDFQPLRYLLAAAGAALLTYTVYTAARKLPKLHSFLQNYPDKILLGSLLLLFAVQAVFLSIAYVPLGWDVTEIIEMASGESLFDTYFIRYPNNTVTTACLKLLFQFTKKFGMDCWLAAILLSAVATDVAVLLICLTVKKVFGLRAFYLTLWLSVLLYAAHPTVATPYSDTYAMPFTAALVFFGVQFCCVSTRRAKCRFAALFGFSLYFGYCIKPTVMLAGIAAAILLFLYLKRPTKTQVVSTVLCAALFAGGILTAAVAAEVANPIIFGRVPTEEQRYEKEFPLSHFLMMGLNERDSDAPYYGYFRSDVKLTASVDGKAEKTELNKRIIRSRLKAFGVSGLLTHCLNKLVWVSTDGTFYYGGEGEFHNGNEKEESGLRGFLQNYLYTETNFYAQHAANIIQGIWLFVLCGAVRACLRRQKNMTAQQAAFRFFLQLTLFGLLLFLMLFEARSRYLFLYLPYFCALAALGYSGTFPGRKKAKKKSSENE